MGFLGSLGWVTGTLAGIGTLTWLFRGCHHPNPHYIRPETERDAATGEEVVVQPAQYCCYECGKTWLATQRDPAWAPTAVVEKFHGYDEQKAVRGMRRMAIQERQRRTLAAKRFRTPTMTGAKSPVSAGRRRRAMKVVDLTSRRPA